MNKKTMATAVAIMLAFVANAAKEYVDGYTWEYTVSGGAATVTGVEPINGTMVIPANLGGCSVKTVGDEMFTGKRCSKVIIPEGVTTIGSKAFWCSQVSCVEIPSTVTYVKNFGVCTTTVAKWIVNPNLRFESGYASYDNTIQEAVSSVLKYWTKRVYASNAMKLYGVSGFAGYIDDAPEVEIVSSAVRENDPTVMDVVYKVYSDKARVKVRALAFKDGQRNLAKAVPVKTLIEGTDANIGDSIAANVEHKLSWKVSADWATDLAKVKFEVLAVEDDLLPMELQTIPATANHAAMKISWNRLTDDKVFDALLWLYADGDTGLTLTNGQLKNGGTILASGTGIYNGQSAVTYVFGKMGYGVLSGSDLTYARRVTQLDLPVGGIQQFAVKTLAQ